MPESLVKPHTYKPEKTGKAARPEGQFPPVLISVCRDSHVVPPKHAFSNDELGGYIPKWTGKAPAGSIEHSVHAWLEYGLGHLPRPKDAPSGMRPELAWLVPGLKAREVWVTGHDDCGFVKAVLQAAELLPLEHGHESHDVSIPRIVEEAKSELVPHMVGEMQSEEGARTRSEALDQLKELGKTDPEALRRRAEAALARVCALNVLTYPAVRKSLSDGRLQKVRPLLYYIHDQSLVELPPSSYWDYPLAEAHRAAKRVS
jgi:carbonic anhydrase